jgi:hypothetical protein
VPFHFSISVRSVVPFEYVPIAIQKLVERQVTPAKAFEWVPTLGLVTADHFVPFHFSMSVFVTVPLE